MIKHSKLYVTDANEQNIIDFINKNKGSIFHEPYLNLLISKYHKTDFFYIVNDVKNIKWLCPVHRKKNKFLVDTYYQPLGDIPYSGFLGTISKNDILSVIKPKMFEYSHYSSLPFFSKGDVNESNLVGVTCMIDTSKSLDHIFNNIISSKSRNMIRKAEKKNVVINEYSDEKGYFLFQKLIKSLHERLGYTIDLKFYEELFTYYAKKNKARIFIAEKENKVVSGILLLGNKNYVHYYKGASIRGNRSVGEGELLQLNAVKWTLNIKSKYYDLCNLNKEKLPGIYRFKTGIAPDLYYYRLNNNRTFSYRLTKKVMKCLKL